MPPQARGTFSEAKTSKGELPVKIKLLKHDLLNNSQISYNYHTCKFLANNKSGEESSGDEDMEEGGGIIQSDNHLPKWNMEVRSLLVSSLKNSQK